MVAALNAQAVWALGKLDSLCGSCAIAQLRLLGLSLGMKDLNDWAKTVPPRTMEQRMGAVRNLVSFLIASAKAVIATAAPRPL